MTINLGTLVVAALTSVCGFAIGVALDRYFVRSKQRHIRTLEVKTSDGRRTIISASDLNRETISRIVDQNRPAAAAF